MSLRRRRWIALLALVGLLFQQFAMAAYVCPLDMQRIATATHAVDALPPCRTPESTDRARCEQHCHPVMPSLDHPAVPDVPPALAPAMFASAPGCLGSAAAPGLFAPSVPPHSTAPPVRVRYCSFQI